MGLIIGAVTNKSTYGVPLTIFCVIILVGLLVESFLKYRKEQQKKYKNILEKREK